MQDWLIGPDEKSVQRIGLFPPEPSAHQIEHEHGDQGHRKDGGKCHRIGLCIGQRAEQSEALSRQRENGQEGNGDNEQGKENPGAHFL